MKEKHKNKKVSLIAVALVIILLPVLGVLVIRMERETPQIEIDLASSQFGVERNLAITVSDKKSGLKSLWIGILKDGQEVVLLEKEFPASGWLKKGSVNRKPINISVKPKELGLKDGNGMLRMVVTDYSWRGWGKGNRTYIEQQINIDTKAPRIEVLTDAHNISPGGAALVLYKISERCQRSGVTVGDNFFPGHPAGVADKDIFLSFFALAHDQAKGTPIRLEAVDMAGNRAKAGFYHYIKSKSFRKDTIRISDGFLTSKLPEFEAFLTSYLEQAPIDQFLHVNRELRRENKQAIERVTARSENKIYWKGIFKRLPGSATRSRFADRRSYIYKGKTIDHQVHMGEDLASNARAPIPAANHGKVVFNEFLGIYGNTIIIDHGFGLFSLYAHLSSVDVEVGQIVGRGDIIGRTGKTGMAGGDHLHFSMLVHNTLVTPLEWWDETWIKNNVSGKLKMFGLVE
ncbi:MAG: M23 family metallopeptidase [Deltaproteobacteria bacterium]|nr:M23 family metallopeptidase [Deltaproteobacteria bacterium]